MKKLVVCYSYEGNTRAVAQAMAEEIGADLLEIKPVNELKSKGFGKYVWGGARVVMNRKPKLLPLAYDAADYDLILVGTPVWAFSMTPPIKTYLAQTSLRHKAVGLFCTHEGGPGKCLAHMRAACEGADVLGEAGFANVLRDAPATTDSARSWAHEMVKALTPSK